MTLEVLLCSLPEEPIAHGFTLGTMVLVGRIDGLPEVPLSGER